jgi:D-3-phosphoglycerate dehydrogenase
MEHCIALPHLGASTEESEDNCAVMAVNELMDYLENGNIRNSVNLPVCDLGRVGAEKRITIIHKNVPNMISQFTSAIASLGLNIPHMANKSKGQIAYTMLDVETNDVAPILEKLNQIPDVVRVRAVN